ncbi:hypothetical protein ASE01_10740 [Nocardioides sp. Root190]|uniref:hypothetical protein n=1 Tax=Nocardioides sp. Root190 TaxID=1736488 RepID=UPI0006FF0B56|nr:hypothetical protein [Nocardioides sp. Root190]KRB77212.1 hypothetical protein ASE01_10740 [Nocardioides sp. Root190]
MFRTIALSLVTGGVLMLFGLSELRDARADADYWNRGGPVPALLGGVAMVGIAVAALVRRLRHGPQEPGRRVKGD